MPDGIRRAMHRVTIERSVAGAFGAAGAFAERIERRGLAPKRDSEAAEVFAERIERRVLAPKRDSEAAEAFAERIERRAIAPKRDSEAAGAYEIAPA